MAVPGSVLQLANFDPDVPRSPRCTIAPDSIPDRGVLLTVGIGAEPDASPATPGEWPTPLEPYGSDARPVCPQLRERASWRAASGVEYWATAGWGPSASQSEVDSLHRAFRTLRFPPTSQGWIRPAGEQGDGVPRAVVDSTTYGTDVLTFVAGITLDGVLSVAVESTGPWAIPDAGSVQNEPVSTAPPIIVNGVALLSGVIAPEVARVEVRTDSGDAVPMHVDPLPASLGDERFVWAILPRAGDRSTIVGYDRDGRLIGNPVYQVEAAQTIATGTEEGKPWTLSATHDNVGWGLTFLWGGEGGGSGGDSDLGDKVFGGANSMSPSCGADGCSPSRRDVDGIVTSDAATVEFRLANGAAVRGSVYPMPAGAYGGGASAFVLFIPNDVAPVGDLVAYDAQGDVLGRRHVAF